jgi:hypothetical protein
MFLVRASFQIPIRISPRNPEGRMNSVWHGVVFSWNESWTYMSKWLSAIAVGFLPIVAVACVAVEPDELRLVDQLFQRAVELENTDATSATLDYSMPSDSSRLIAMLPTSGLREDELPQGLAADQRARLHEAAQMFVGKPRVAVVSEAAVSAGPL